MHGLRNIWSPIVRRLRLWSQSSTRGGQRTEKPDERGHECGQNDKDQVEDEEEEGGEQKNKLTGKTMSAEMTRQQQIDEQRTESSFASLRGEKAAENHYKCSAETEKENRRRCLVKQRKLGQFQSQDPCNNTSFNPKDNRSSKSPRPVTEDDKSKVSSGGSWQREAARSGFRKSCSSHQMQRLSMDETRRRMESWRRVTKPRRSETYINPSDYPSVVQQSTTRGGRQLVKQATEDMVIMDRSKSFSSSSQKRPLRARKSAPLLPVTRE